MPKYELAQLNIAQMKEPLELLRVKGPTQEAFTFRQAFPAPDAMPESKPTEFGDECPAT